MLASSYFYVSPNTCINRTEENNHPTPFSCMATAQQGLNRIIYEYNKRGTLRIVL